MPTFPFNLPALFGESPAGSYDFGINQIEISGGDQYITEADTRRVLQEIRVIGASRVRVMVAWDFIETTRGVYQWQNLDRAINLCAEYALKPLLVISVGPDLFLAAFGIPSPHMPQWASPQTYGDFCKQLALRYGPSGTSQASDFEIWNEPNNIAFFPQAKQPGVFAEYVKAAYSAIKPVHPGSTVITAGTMPTGTGWPALDPLEFITGMYDAGVQNYCDGIGYHWYNNGPSFETVPPSLTAPYWVRLTQVHDLMVARGDGAKKIWVTEFGVSQPPLDNLTARDQLKTMVDQLKTLSYLGPPFIYNYRDSIETLGLVDKNFNKKQPTWDYVSTLRGSDTADVTPPSAPTGVTAETITSTSVSLVWNPSTDNVGVTGYQVFNFGNLITSVPGTVYTANDLSAGQIQSFTVKAVDAAGNVSAASSMITPQTLAPAGSQSFFDYQFTSSVPQPTVFTEFGQGFTVDGSGVARNDTAGTDGVKYSGGYYNDEHLTADHYSQIRLANDTQRADRAAIALVRFGASTGDFVGALVHYGGKNPTADAAKIITNISGTVTVRAARNANGLTGNDDLRLVASGNTYTAYKITNGDLVELVSWPDTAGVYSGKTNLRSGFGFQHIRSGGVNYDAPGITGRWRGQDVAGLQSEMEMWTLGLVKEKDWADLFGGAPWESLV